MTPAELADFGLAVKSTLVALVLLPLGPLLLALFGALIASRRRALGLTLVVLGLGVIVVLSLPSVSYWIEAPIERLYPPLADDVPIPAGAAIVVLGGGSEQAARDYGGETVNAITLVRLRRAARLAARTGLPILVSGGRPVGATYSEAQLMAATLRDDFRIKVRWIESSSHNTEENARRAAPLLRAAGIGTALLVTDVRHIPRARADFIDQGIAVIAAPTDYYAATPLTFYSWLPNTGALRRSSNSLHEWIGMFWRSVGK